MSCNLTSTVGRRSCVGEIFGLFDALVRAKSRLFIPVYICCVPVLLLKMSILFSLGVKVRSNLWFETNDRHHFIKWPVYKCKFMCLIMSVVFALIILQQHQPIKVASGLNIEQAARFELSLDSLVGLQDKLSPFHNIQPDAYLDPPEFIRSRKFLAEVHHVTTKDNYILTLHRIINPLVPEHLRSRLKPVLLQHGLFTSSFNFIIAADRNLRPQFNPSDLVRTKPLFIYTPFPLFSWQRFLETLNDFKFTRLGITTKSSRAPQIGNSLGFEMANQGYDVWMGNSRGSTYSLNHTLYDHRYDWRYWDFSFHEIALYDFPAQIDYILNYRERKSLAFIGHSQGNLAMFILQSFQPEWALKIKPFIAAAPIAFIPNVYYGLVRTVLKILSPFLTPTSLNQVLKGQVSPKSQATEQMLDLICIPKWTTFICDLLLTAMLGNSLIRANNSLTPIVAHHIPEGTSVLNVLHFSQLIESGEFRAFDFGPRENLRRYGSTINPYYPIKNIISHDIAFVSGRTDTLSTMKNVAITKSLLPVPLIDDYVVPALAWGHGDYMYGAYGAGVLANLHMISLVDRYRLIP